MYINLTKCKILHLRDRDRVTLSLYLSLDVHQLISHFAAFL